MPVSQDEKKKINSNPSGVVLIVDDELLVLDYLRILLAHEPYRIITAQSGQDAIKILKKEPVDVLLTDLMMPGVTGIELIQHARKLQPFTLQIIIHTAFGKLDSAISAMRMGASDYLLKPLKSETLKASIADACQRAEELKKAQKNISEVKEKSLSIFENVHAGIILVDDSTHEIVDINPAACKMIGVQKPELIGQLCYKTICATGSGSCPVTDQDVPVNNAAHFLKTKTGRIRPVIKSVTKITSGGRTLRLETFLDLSEHEQLRRDLEDSRSTFHAIVDKSLDGIVIIDEAGFAQFANNAACELFCKQKDEIVGRKFPYPVINGTATEIDIHETADIKIVAEMLVAESEWEGKPAHVATLRNISERKILETITKELANHDHLTGLPNRRLLLDRLSVSLNRSKRRAARIAIFFIDLDGFKPINDSFGHETGDQVLKIVAKRLKKAIRNSDTVARAGGDEFIVILNDIKNLSSVSHVAQKIISLINEPIHVAEKEHFTGCSIGISLYPQDGNNHFELMKNADKAMYGAKENGGNAYLYFGDISDSDNQAESASRM